VFLSLTGRTAATRPETAKKKETEKQEMEKIA